MLVEGEPQTLSLMATAGEMTCLTGGSAERRTRWLLAMLGFQSVTHGYISIDGEPLTPASSAVFPSLIASATFSNASWRLSFTFSVVTTTISFVRSVDESCQNIFVGIHISSQYFCLCFTYTFEEELSQKKRIAI